LRAAQAQHGDRGGVAWLAACQSIRGGGRGGSRQVVGVGGRGSCRGGAVGGGAWWMLRCARGRGVGYGGCVLALRLGGRAGIGGTGMGMGVNRDGLAVSIAWFRGGAQGERWQGPGKGARGRAGCADDRGRLALLGGRRVVGGVRGRERGAEMGRGVWEVWPGGGGGGPERACAAWVGPEGRG